jgi:hypothetical protein
MKLDDERERPFAGRFKKPNQQRHVAVANILDILDRDFVVCQCNRFHTYLLKKLFFRVYSKEVFPTVSKVEGQRPQKFYPARFAPFEFFVPFVVNFLEFVLRVLRAFVVIPPGDP